MEVLPSKSPWLCNRRRTNPRGYFDFSGKEPEFDVLDVRGSLEPYVWTGCTFVGVSCWISSPFSNFADSGLPMQSSSFLPISSRIPGRLSELQAVQWTENYISKANCKSLRKTILMHLRRNRAVRQRYTQHGSSMISLWENWSIPLVYLTIASFI